MTRIIDRINKNHPTKATYTGIKLSSQFVLKDQTIKEHKNGLVYKVLCSEDSCSATYIGEVSRRLSERIKDHGGRDRKSHVYTHALEKGQTLQFFLTIGNYQNIIIEQLKLFI